MDIDTMSTMDGKRTGVNMRNTKASLLMLKPLFMWTWIAVLTSASWLSNSSRETVWAGYDSWLLLQFSGTHGYMRLTEYHTGWWGMVNGPYKRHFGIERISSMRRSYIWLTLNMICWLCKHPSVLWDTSTTVHKYLGTRPQSSRGWGMCALII